MATTTYPLKDGGTLEVTTIDKTITYKESVITSVDKTITYKETTTRIIPPVIVDPGTTVSFTPAIIPFSEPDLNAPARGVEQWHDANIVNVPTEGVNTQRLDCYYRFTWSRIEKSVGMYDWTYFDSLVNTAISKGQKLNFGIMTSLPGGAVRHGLVDFGGGNLGSYPSDLHQQMQRETVKDWLKGTIWTPNYNSPAYLTRWATFLKDVNARIVSKGWSKVIGIIDIRGYGSWGEWNSSSIVSNTSEYPAGTFPTVASLKKIVDAHTLGFPDFPLVAMIAAFDGGRLANINNPAEIGYYILTTKNNWGPIGWRRDQWGATDGYLANLLENNNTTFNGVVFKTLIMDRWKTSPITGEPAPNNYDMADLERQVRLYHASSFGNGNYNNSGTALTTAQKDRVRAASKACGYRIQIEGGSITTGANGKISINWRNSGFAPTYENWNVVFELRSGTSVVWTGTSLCKLKLFQPSATATIHTDSFINIPVGNYSLVVKIVDPNGYRQPLVLANRGRNSDGSYTLK